MAKRPKASTDLRVKVCIYPGVWESSASLALDLLHLADAVAQAYGSRRINTQVVGPHRGEVDTANGRPAFASSAWGKAPADLIVLPSMTMSMMDASDDPPGLTAWLTAQHARGAWILAITTGSWLLAKTKLLDGGPAATHWACVTRCRTLHPKVAWSSGERVTRSDRLVTARDMDAAGTALCHILGQLTHSTVAERTYEYSLMRAPGAAMLPLLRTLSFRAHHDSTVLRVQEWLEAHYAETIPAAELARKAHLSPRSLRRRFREATGTTISNYRTEVRLARARAALLTTDDPVAQIAYAVGYENPSSFISVFRSRQGKTPAAYRRESHLQLIGEESA